jgi:hypothetical protein
LYDVSERADGPDGCEEGKDEREERGACALEGEHERRHREIRRSGESASHTT